LALGFIYCYFYQRCVWKATFLLISLIPASIIANALRVAAMGIYPALQEGFWHGFSGWLIFLFCFGFLAFFNWFLNRLSPQAQGIIASVPKDDQLQAPVSSKAPLPYLYVALCIVILGGIVNHTICDPPSVPLLQSLDNFPLQLNGWQGKRTFISSEIFEKTEADSYFDAEYTSSGKQAVSLYIASYEKQTTAGGLGHNPAACMTGSGWHPVASGIKEIAPGLSVNYLLLTRQDASIPILVYYWNIHQGHWMALSSPRLYKLFTIYNYLRVRRSDWALIRIITPVENDVEAANDRLASFARLLLPVLPQFFRK
jgi:EpsI family protein